jgi:hypothetical protein
MSPGPDEARVDTSVRDGVVWIRVEGKAQFQTALAAMKSAAQQARSSGSDRLVFDIRAAIHSDYHVTTLESARRAADLGLGPALRIAILGLEGDPQLKFIEDVAANRGFQARAFSDEAAALTWVNAKRR